MKDVVKDATGYDFDSINSDEEALNLVKSMGIPLEKDKSYTKYGLLNLLFEEKVESTLANPTFITEYPKEISPLSKNKKDFYVKCYSFNICCKKCFSWSSCYKNS